MNKNHHPQLSPEALTRILEVTRKLAAPFDIMTMLAEVLDAGVTVLDADQGTLWLYEEDDRRLVMKLPEWDPPLTRESGAGLVGACELEREIINVPDCDADPRFIDILGASTDYVTRCAMYIPLIGYEDKTVGVMQLLNKDGGVFDENDEHLATILAAQCAVALQRTQMTEALLAKERLDEEVTLARER